VEVICSLARKISGTIAESSGMKAGKRKCQYAKN